MRLRAAGLRSADAKGCGSRESSGGFLDAAEPDARGADAHVLAHAVHDGLHAAKIRIPAAAAGIIGVADYVAVVRPFAAVFTLQSHVLTCFFLNCYRTEPLV